MSMTSGHLGQKSAGNFASSSSHGSRVFGKLISVTVGSAGAPGACSAPGSLGGAPAAPA